MKATFKEINQIINQTPKELHGKYVSGKEIGYFRSQNCNWAYRVILTWYRNEPILVATAFGCIIAKGE